jgi:hypothetical protein
MPPLVHGDWLLLSLPDEIRHGQPVNTFPLFTGCDTAQKQQACHGQNRRKTAIFPQPTLLSGFF